MPGIPSELLNDILAAPHAWDALGDDNRQGECLPQTFVKKIVVDYIASPNDPQALRSLGLLTLFLGIAQWGIADPAGLPDDPQGKHWGSVTGVDSGKHLMSYSIGGVGATHADVGLLAEFIARVAEQPYVPANQRAAILRLTDPTLYGGHEVKYDQIRCAALCVKQDFTLDLMGEPFHHFHTTADSEWCRQYNRSKLAPQDWLVFKTWMRVALRDRVMQDWLLSRWLDTDWLTTTRMVPAGEGYAEESLLNARVRNSSPSLANKAVRMAATSVGEKIRRELDTYGELESGKTLRRRCRLMLRPVVLFRHFAGLEHLSGISCPPPA